MIHRAAWVLLVSFSLAGESAFAARETIAGPIDVEVLRIVDGDNFVALALIWPGLRQEVNVRIRGVDAPEVKGRCAREKHMAAQATLMLEGLLSGGGIQLRNVSRGKYAGRVVADVASSDKDIAKALLNGGVVVPYDGKKRKGFC